MNYSHEKNGQSRRNENQALDTGSEDDLGFFLPDAGKKISVTSGVLFLYPLLPDPRVMWGCRPLGPHTRKRQFQFKYDKELLGTGRGDDQDISDGRADYIESAPFLFAM